VGGQAVRWLHQFYRKPEWGMCNMGDLHDPDTPNLHLPVYIRHSAEFRSFDTGFNRHSIVAYQERSPINETKRQIGFSSSGRAKQQYAGPINRNSGRVN
jgi:hypothetical protein